MNDRALVPLVLGLIPVVLAGCDGSTTMGTVPDATVPDATVPDAAVASDAAFPIDGSSVDASADGGEAPGDGGAPETYACTRVIGYSQTSQWFMAEGVFESIVGTDTWELMWSNGATLESYRDPSSPVWSARVRSPCAGGHAPDRVVLNLAGLYGDDGAAWAAAIDETIANIRTQLPSVRAIVLQPIVGGPMNGPCMLGPEPVQASLSHPHQDAAAAAAAGGDVVVGPSPEVRDCTDYNDALGHLTRVGATGAAETIAAHYR